MGKRIIYWDATKQGCHSLKLRESYPVIYGQTVNLWFELKCIAWHSVMKPGSTFLLWLDCQAYEGEVNTYKVRMHFFGLAYQYLYRFTLCLHVSCKMSQGRIELLFGCRHIFLVGFIFLLFCFSLIWIEYFAYKVHLNVSFLQFGITFTVKMLHVVNVWLFFVCWAFLFIDIWIYFTTGRYCWGWKYSSRFQGCSSKFCIASAANVCFLPINNCS